MYVHILLVTIVLTIVVADMLTPLLSSWLTTLTCPLVHAWCRAVRPNYIMITISTITTCHKILNTSVTSQYRIETIMIICYWICDGCTNFLFKILSFMMAIAWYLDFIQIEVRIWLYTKYKYCIICSTDM